MSVVGFIAIVQRHLHVMCAYLKLHTLAELCVISMSHTCKSGRKLCDSLERYHYHCAVRVLSISAV